MTASGYNHPVPRTGSPRSHSGTAATFSLYPELSAALRIHLRGLFRKAGGLGFPQAPGSTWALPASGMPGGRSAQVTHTFCTLRPEFNGVRPNSSQEGEGTRASG